MGMILGRGARPGVSGVPLARLAGEDVRENRLQRSFATERACERPLFQPFVLDIAEQALPPGGVVCLS